MAEEALMADDAPPVAPSASTASLDALRATINTALGFWYIAQISSIALSSVCCVLCLDSKKSMMCRAPFALERRRAALDRAAAALEDARNDR